MRYQSTDITFSKSPPLPSGVMKPVIIEKPAIETLIQRAGEVCRFYSSKTDMAAHVEYRDSTVKHQSPSATHGDREESGSNEFKYAENKRFVVGTAIRAGTC